MISRPNGIACSLVLAVLLSAPATLLAGDFSKRLDDAFKRADKDKDGTLDRNEAEAAAAGLEAFRPHRREQERRDIPD